MVKKKILLLVTLSELGGAQKVVYHLAAGLDREKFDITVACAPGGELVGWLKKLSNIKIIELACLKRTIHPVQDFFCFFRLYRLIKLSGFDIVHCHSSKAGIMGRLAAYLARVRQVYFTVHGWVIDEQQRLPVRWLYTLAERLAGALSTRVVCVSEYDRERGLALRLADADKLIVIHNGVPDIYDSPAAGNKLRMELGLGSGDNLIGAVMRLAPPKLPLFFLELAARLHDHIGCFYFAIIGDGPLRPRCEEYIAEHNLGKNVFLLGTRENSSALVSGFDIFTLFSSHEGLPLVIIEAMLAGVPVVAGNVGGVGEMVVHGETGYLVDSFDLDIALGYIEELLQNPDLRAKMGAAGRRRALEMFSMERMLSRYDQLYSGNL